MNIEIDRLPADNALSMIKELQTLRAKNERLMTENEVLIELLLLIQVKALRAMATPGENPPFEALKKIVKLTKDGAQ